MVLLRFLCGIANCFGIVLVWLLCGFAMVLLWFCYGVGVVLVRLSSVFGAVLLCLCYGLDVAVLQQHRQQQ